jgi:imidazolonepropionase
MKVDLIIHSATQLVTCASVNGPKRGPSLRDVGLVPGGAVAIADGTIIAIGPSADIHLEYTARESIDASNQVVCPGFVDPHTHLVYAGDRVAEFELRIQGATYMEIMTAGGGILSSMQATRATTLEQLVASAKHRLDQMLALGTTTVEIKTGYGLNTTSELKMLQAIAALDAVLPVDVVPTFLGAHTVPPEYKGQADKYVGLIITEMLPAVQKWYKTANFKIQNSIPFCDVFCEANAFNLEQTRRIMQTGLELGLPVKIHADEFQNLGGVGLAVEMGAISADHLDITPFAEIEALAASNTIGIILPAVNFNLGSSHYADARTMVDKGVALALATDFNPGSAPCLSVPLVMAIACRYQRLLPAEVMNASTINAAHAIGLGAQLGSIEVGKQADLLILDVPDYRYLTYQFGGNPVSKVFKRGKLVYESQY